MRNSDSLSQTHTETSVVIVNIVIGSSLPSLGCFTVPALKKSPPCSLASRRVGGFVLQDRTQWLHDVEHKEHQQTNKKKMVGDQQQSSLEVSFCARSCPSLSSACQQTSFSPVCSMLSCHQKNFFFCFPSVDQWGKQPSLSEFPCSHSRQIDIVVVRMCGCVDVECKAIETEGQSLIERRRLKEK